MPDLTQLNEHPLNRRALEFLNEMKENPDPQALHLSRLMILALQESLPDALMARIYELDQTKMMGVLKGNLTVSDLKGLTPRHAGLRIAEQIGLDLTEYRL